MPQKIVIVDYGMGNHFSIMKRVDKMNCEVISSNAKEDLAAADKIILPGVGHFGKAVQNLKNLDLFDSLNEAVLIQKKPILGICLGLQLMAKSSEEGEVEGFGWFDAAVIRFNIRNSLKFKIPHIGWNRVSQKKDSILFNNIPDNSEFYFVHAFHVQTDRKADILSLTNYEYDFVSALEKDNIFGVQFHPEKSHDIGNCLLKNFISL